jgi:hypothetical protein
MIFMATLKDYASIAGITLSLVALDSHFQTLRSQPQPTFSWRTGEPVAIKRNDLRIHVIQPALTPHGLWCADSEELLMLTAAQESKLGFNLTQEGNGYAKSPWQIEPPTFKWMQERYPMLIGTRKVDELLYDLRLAALVARLRYRVVQEALPSRFDVIGMATYYKKYFNTYMGAATVAEAMKNYKLYVIEGKGE